jgi:hypothetical protein
MHGWFGVQNGGNHTEWRGFIEAEGVRARGDVHLIGDSKDGLEANALLTYIWMYIVQSIYETGG